MNQEKLIFSSDLTDDIEEALNNSEFLIVTCSTNVAQSTWGEEEIELFCALMIEAKCF